MLHVLPLLLLAHQDPDVLLVIMDDVGVEDIALVDTPQLDSLAARGVTFSSFYVGSWCKQTRANLVLGKWTSLPAGDLCGPGEPGAQYGEQIPPGTPNLFSYFDGLGYDTVHVGKWHLGNSNHGLSPWTLAPYALGGIDRSLAMQPSSGVVCDPPGFYSSTRVDDGVPTEDSTHRLIQQRDAILEAYWSRQSGNPFFGVLAFTEAHAPWDPVDEEILPPGYVRPAYPMQRDFFEEEIVGIDEAIRDVLEDGNGTYPPLPPSFWIIVMGDNGTPSAVDVDTLRGSKHATYDGGIRSPLIFAGPGLPQRATMTHPVHAVDLVASLAQALRGSQPAWMEGRSVFSPSRGWVVCTAFGSAGGPTVVEEFGGIFRKLHQTPGGRETLFELSSDPGEWMGLRAPWSPGEQIHVDRMRAIRACVGL